MLSPYETALPMVTQVRNHTGAVVSIGAPPSYGNITFTFVLALYVLEKSFDEPSLVLFGQEA